MCVDNTAMKGGGIMALSSIFKNIVLKSDEDINSFLEAIELSQHDNSVAEKVDVNHIESEKSLRALLDKLMEVNA